MLFRSVSQSRYASQDGASVGQVLKWNGTQWAPGVDATGGGSGGGGIPEAPMDGYSYIRQDEEWVRFVPSQRITLPISMDSLSANYAGYTVFTKLPEELFFSYPPKWRFALRLQNGSNIYIGAIHILRTVAGSLNVVDSFAVTIGGSASPTVTPPDAGIHDYFTDDITLQLLPGFDYYIAVYFTSASDPTVGSGVS